MPATTFGLRLKELRRQAGLTQVALAKAAGLSKTGVTDLEQGRREPSWRTLLALADALRIELSRFREPPAKSNRKGK
jgi:transcriptional regulator with XRE-family HTH domain